MSGENLIEDLLHFYRLQRHDFMNQFQVIIGYLQMGKSQKALDYLWSAVAECELAAPISRLGPAELAVEMMLLKNTCFEHAVEFSLKIEENLPIIEWEPKYSASFEVLKAIIPGAGSIQMNLMKSGKDIRLSICLAAGTSRDWIGSINALKELKLKAADANIGEKRCIEIILG